MRTLRPTARLILSSATAVAIACSVLAAAATAAHAVTACVIGPSCPQANDDPDYTTTFNTKLTVDAAHGVLANDFGPVTAANGGPTTVDVANSVSDGGGSNGHFPSFDGADVAIKSDGSFVYTPDPTNPFSGIDSFDYDIKDTEGDTDFATATVTVIPVVKDDTYYTKVNTAMTVAPAHGVLANDSGIDPSSLTADSTSAHGGAVSVNGDGSFEYTPPSGFSGTDTFTYDVFDIDWDNDYTATVHILVDSTPPKVSLSQPGSVTLSTKATVAWAASDSSGIAHYDVQEAVAPWNAGFAAWANWKPGVTVQSASAATTYGRTYCFRARAMDRAGNTSGWVQRCTTIPLRVASLAHRGSWSTQTNGAYFSGAAMLTRAKGATLTRTGVQARQLYLVVTKCSTCGSVQVRWNNAVIANVGLSRSAVATRQVIEVAAFSSVRSGTVTVIVTSATGKPVVVEGLGVLRA